MADVAAKKAKTTGKQSMVMIAADDQVLIMVRFVAFGTVGMVKVRSNVSSEEDSFFRNILCDEMRAQLKTKPQIEEKTA